jgi:DNA relaxase NicK
MADEDRSEFPDMTVAQLKAHIDERFAAVDARFEAVDARFDEVKRHITVTVESLADEVRTAAGGAAEALAKLAGFEERNAAEHATMTRRLDEHDVQLARVKRSRRR